MKNRKTQFQMPFYNTSFREMFWSMYSEVFEPPEVIYTSSSIPQAFREGILQQLPSWLHFVQPS